VLEELKGDAVSRWAGVGADTLATAERKRGFSAAQRKVSPPSLSTLTYHDTGTKTSQLTAFNSRPAGTSCLARYPAAEPVCSEFLESRPKRGCCDADLNWKSQTLQSGNHDDRKSALGH